MVANRLGQKWASTDAQMADLRTRGQRQRIELAEHMLRICEVEQNKTKPKSPGFLLNMAVVTNGQRTRCKLRRFRRDTGDQTFAEGDYSRYEETGMKLVPYLGWKL